MVLVRGLRVIRYPGQPALVVSGGQAMGRLIYDGRVGTHWLD